MSKSSLHWFIRSRPFVLIPEIRRRFDLDGSDEVRAIWAREGKTYVGLPERAARLLEDLAREQRVGLEYIVDLQARLAIGVYAYDLLKTPPGIHSAPARQHEEPAGPQEDGEVAAKGTAPADSQRSFGPRRPMRPPGRPDIPMPRHEGQPERGGAHGPGDRRVRGRGRDRRGPGLPWTERRPP